jgi:uncharacterized protein
MVDGEVQFAGGDGLLLSGRLMAPAAKELIPGLVMLGGSGPSDRDNDGFFVPLRNHLVGLGVGVLSYDKRGVGESEGRWESATVDELAADAVAALDLIRNHPTIDGLRVSLFGHSEGGWVALRACLGGVPPRRLIVNSAPAVSFLEAEVHALHSQGFSEHECAQARALLIDLVDLVEAGSDVDTGQGLLDARRGEAWFDRFEQLGFTLTEPMWAQLRAWGRYDPEPDLRRCAVPTTAFFGGSDPLVPVAASIEAYDQTAIVAGREQSTEVFPEAGHRMNPPASDAVVPGYLERLGHLIQAT